MSTAIGGRRPSYNNGRTSAQKPSANSTKMESSPSWAIERPHTNARGQLVTNNIGLANTAIQQEETETSLANVSVIDRQKVAQLRQAIQEGTYRVDAKQIADKLIALERTLGK